MKTLFYALLLIMTAIACGDEQPYNKGGAGNSGDALPDEGENPDPNDPTDPDPSNSPDPEPTTDGAKLYKAKCSVCHKSIEISTIRNKTAMQIHDALGRVKKMKSIVITDAEIDAIAAALKTK